MNISERLRQVIEDSGVTPYEISVKTGIEESVISRILREITRKPRKTTISAIAKYLQISENWLLTGLGDMRAGHDNHEELDQALAVAVQNLAAKGESIGGSVPHEFVQQLFRERETHDQMVLSLQKTIEEQRKTIETQQQYIKELIELLGKRQQNKV